jgi:hypothetical protein
MKFQTERCFNSKCGTLRRPTDLKSKHSNVLDETGQFLLTDFWFCSDECFEEVLEVFIEPEYSLKYKFGTLTYGIPFPGQASPTLSPGLTKTLNRLEGLYRWGRKRNMFAPDWVEDFKNDFGRYPEPDEVPKVEGQLKNLMREAGEDWKFQQELAVDRAKVKMNDELTAEDIRLFDIQREKNMKELEATWERNARDQERRKKEEERLEEKRQREEEKRAREEADLAAKEAEEAKWRPRPFKI